MSAKKIHFFYLFSWIFFNYLKIIQANEVFELGGEKTE